MSSMNVDTLFFVEIQKNFCVTAQDMRMMVICMVTKSSLLLEKSFKMVPFKGMFA